MTSPLGSLGVFLLLLACAGLWYGARTVRQTKAAPRWALALDRHRAIAVLLLAAAVITLVGFGIAALLAPWLASA